MYVGKADSKYVFGCADRTTASGLVCPDVCIPEHIFNSAGRPPAPCGSQPSTRPSDAHRGPEAPYPTTLSCICGGRQVTLWLPTSDGGSDVSRFRRVLKMETRNSVTDIVVDANCVMHNDHLIVKSGLGIVDEWCRVNKLGFKWFSSLSILVNTWRDVARQAFLTAERLPGLGPIIALEHFKHMPARCIAGRWHSVTNSVRRKLKVGKQRWKQPSASNVCTFYGALVSASRFPKFRLCERGCLGPVGCWEARRASILCYQN
jgi:hypothetical protein